MTFKVGDRVRAAADLGNGVPKGIVGKVLRGVFLTSDIYVLFDSGIEGWFNVADLHWLPTDTDRMRFLAGCGHTNGPAVDEFDGVKDDFYDLLRDVMDENDNRDDQADYRQDVAEATDDEKLEAFRRLIDKAMEGKP